MVLAAFVLGALIHPGMVGLARASQDEIAVELSGLLPWRLEEVQAVLLDFPAYTRWFPQVASFEVLERAEGSARVHGRQRFPWPVADRDYVVRYVWEWPRDPFELVATGVADSPPPPPEGVVRIQRMTTRWELTREGACTRARYLYRGEAGPLGEWLGELALRSLSQRVIEGLGEELASRSGGAAPLNCGRETP